MPAIAVPVLHLGASGWATAHDGTGSSFSIESDPGFGSRGLRDFATSQTSRGPGAATDNGAQILLLNGHPPDDHYACCGDNQE